MGYTMAQSNYYQVRNERSLRETGLTYNQVRAIAEQTQVKRAEVHKALAREKPEDNKYAYEQRQRHRKGSITGPELRANLRKRYGTDIPIGIGWYH